MSGPTAQLQEVPGGSPRPSLWARVRLAFRRLRLLRRLRLIEVGLVEAGKAFNNMGWCDDCHGVFMRGGLEEIKVDRTEGTYCRFCLQKIEAKVGRKAMAAARRKT